MVLGVVLEQVELMATTATGAEKKHPNYYQDNKATAGTIRPEPGQLETSSLHGVCTVEGKYHLHLTRAFRGDERREHWCFSSLFHNNVLK